MDISDLEIVGPLAGGAGQATVDLVRAAGRLWVLKRHRPAEITAERRFQRLLKDQGLPSLGVEDCHGLGPDQILLEYVPDSPTIGGSPPADLCRRWGEAVGRLHRIGSPTFARLDVDGRVVAGIWRDYLADRIAAVTARQRQPGADLPESLVDQAEHSLASLLAFEPPRFVLTHGDLHLNNALVRDDGVVLFDKPYGVWFAPPQFDLALIISEAFPGAGHGADRPGDTERMSAFAQGYGGGPLTDLPWLDHFVLLRLLERYPSPFVPEMRAILQCVLKRVGSN